LFAFYIGKPDLGEIILSYNPTLNVFDLTALGHAGPLSTLLASDGKIVHQYSGDGFTALHIASYFGQADAAELLLEHGADVNKVATNGTDLRAIHSAVAGCHKDVVKVLLHYNPDINVKMVGGFTPLMSATALKADEIVDLLIAHGADKNIKADDGRTAAEFS
ncbi:MAG: ankyrin repeat domain-containing protein, partial [Proteobacteria bacterium]|nr:ankyrin repeat domain-containing protein [Pseudomonadota bacterium]